MSEAERTIERQRQATMAVIAALRETFQEDQKVAMANLESNLRSALAQAPKPRRNWIGFILSIIVKLFLNNDAPVYLPDEEDAPDYQTLLEQARRDSEECYKGMFNMLERAEMRVKNGLDSVAKSAYAEFVAVAAGRQHAAQALSKLTDICGAYRTHGLREFLDSLEKDPADLEKLRKLIKTSLTVQEEAAV